MKQLMSLLYMRHPIAPSSHWLATYKTNTHTFAPHLFIFFSFFGLNCRSFLPSGGMKMSLVSSIVLLFLLISTSKAHIQGTVTADIFTFDRILEKFDTVLVKFDEKFRTY